MVKNFDNGRADVMVEWNHVKYEHHGANSYMVHDGIMNTQVNDQVNNQMMNVVERLPEEHRVLISLVFGLGGHDPLSEEEIAEELGLSAGDVRNVCDDALRLLRTGSQGASASKILLQ